MKHGYSISEAATKAGVSVHRIRIYVELGLVSPCETNRNGYRVFNDDCLERLRLIQVAVQSGLLLRDLSRFMQAIDRGDATTCKAEQAALAIHLASRREAVRTCQVLLSRVVDRAAAPHPAGEAP